MIKPAGRNVLALPKGHIEKGETSQKTAEREILEAQQFFAEGSTVDELQRFTVEQLSAYRNALRDAGVEPN